MFETELKDLIGKKIINIEGLSKGSEQVTIYCEDHTYMMMGKIDDHVNESIIDDVIGDVNDLLGSTILIAETTQGSDSLHNWTFYKISTRNGYVDIRWYGDDDNIDYQYAARVDFFCMKKLALS